MSPSPDYDKTCFFIAPIGTEGSDVRLRSDTVRDYIVKPVAQKLGFVTVRADDVAKPGQITLQVVQHVLRASAAVADLTGANPNVYYELAVRHTAKLPVVLIAEEDEIEKLPFDLQQMRVIPFNHRDIPSVEHAKAQIEKHLKEGQNGEVDSPIATVLNLEALEAGVNPSEHLLAELVTRVDQLDRFIRSTHPPTPPPVATPASVAPRIFGRVVNLARTEVMESPVEAVVNVQGEQVGARRLIVDVRGADRPVIFKEHNADADAAVTFLSLLKRILAKAGIDARADDMQLEEPSL